MVAKMLGQGVKVMVFRMARKAVLSQVGVRVEVRVVLVVW
jgi:hypothetical protein